MESGTIQPLTIYEGANHLKYISIGAILRYHHQNILDDTSNNILSINQFFNQSITNQRFIVSF